VATLPAASTSPGADGRRLHVVRRENEERAAVVRRIFALCARCSTPPASRTCRSRPPCGATPRALDRGVGEAYADWLLTSPMGAPAVEYGYASQADLEAMAAAVRTWAVHPDALWSFIHVAALARKE
jgi:hypothetical protein